MSRRITRPGDASTPPWILRLRRHIAWVLVAKVGLIAILYSAFFSPAHRPAIDSSEVMQRIAPNHGSQHR